MTDLSIHNVTSVTAQKNSSGSTHWINIEVHQRDTEWPVGITLFGKPEMIQALAKAFEALKEQQ